MQLIHRHLTMIPIGKVSGAIALWKKFSDELMSIVGEKGFLTLYSRSLNILRETFPALVNFDAEISHATWLAELEAALSEQDLAGLNSVNYQLFMNFTDILASLIGEDLTVEILHASWGDTETKRIPANKEIEDAK
jgi:hypothetical protein